MQRNIPTRACPDSPPGEVHPGTIYVGNGNTAFIHLAYSSDNVPVDPHPLKAKWGALPRRFQWTVGPHPARDIFTRTLGPSVAQICNELSSKDRWSSISLHRVGYQESIESSPVTVVITLSDKLVSAEAELLERMSILVQAANVPLVEL